MEGPSDQTVSLRMSSTDPSKGDKEGLCEIGFKIEAAQEGHVLLGFNSIGISGLPSLGSDLGGVFLVYCVQDKAIKVNSLSFQP